MPTYEYQCPDGHVFEKFQKMTDKPRAKCPVCGADAERLLAYKGERETAVGALELLSAGSDRAVRDHL